MVINQSDSLDLFYFVRLAWAVLEVFGNLQAGLANFRISAFYVPFVGVPTRFHFLLMMFQKRIYNSYVNRSFGRIEALVNALTAIAS